MASANTTDPGAMAPPLSNALGLDDTLGVVLVCTCFGCMLFGLTTHQTYRYFRLYPTDSLILKFFVILILGIDILNTMLSIHICYFYLITNYFNPVRLLDGVWSIRLIVISTGCMMIVSHLFYARRVYLLSGGTQWPVVLIVVLLFAELGLCIGATIEAFLQPTFKGYQHFAWLICSALGAAVLLDLFISSMLILYLRKSRTGFKRTDSMVDVLMVYSINTGLSTSIVNFTAAITAITMPDKLVYTGLYIFASKMYSNSLLAVLNSRRSLVDKGMEGFETGSFGLSVNNIREKTIQFRSPGSPRAITGPSAAPVYPGVIDVKITTETFQDRGTLPGPGKAWEEQSAGRPGSSDVEDNA
ncbi:hypothetical protein BD311DRAFT_765124 [Dichomitus squalens]|uniref:DUF6534 domain-containing protein n=1 Tax=Dichomitus squalens TaxID=114155 RepID=A0A4Q9MD26_9APHY|nr:hypothetical protein BD311DRAFT_765124 [Dichomitus squalens]